MKKYAIYRHIGNLSNLNNGWTKELNLISWNDREPVYDIMSVSEKNELAHSASGECRS